MSTSTPSVDRRGGLLNVADIVIAPNAAFDRLRIVPAWLWAFIVATLLAVVGSLLAQPALLHAFETSMPAQLAADPNMAKLPADQQQKQIAMIMGFSRTMFQLGWLIVPFAILIASLLQALALTVVNAIGKGQGSFAKFFALAVTVSVVGTGLYYLVFGLVAVLRGASSFETMSAMQSLVPGFALLVPGAHGATAGFLGAFNVFYLWATALLALGTVRIARISPGLAWGAPIVLLLLTACFSAFGQRNG